MFAKLGSISSGTLRREDTIPAFADKLESLMRQYPEVAGDASQWEELIIEARAINDYESDEAYYIEMDLGDALSTFAPPYCYFGAHYGDGADFGFWPCEDFEDRMKEDGVVILPAGDATPARENAPDGVAYVTDHGNVSFGHVSAITGEFVEEWSIV